MRIFTDCPSHEFDLRELSRVYVGDFPVIEIYCASSYRQIIQRASLLSAQRIPPNLASEKVREEDKVLVFQNKPQQVLLQVFHKGRCVFQDQQNISKETPAKSISNRLLIQWLGTQFPSVKNPWGIVTGIHPVKLAARRKEEPKEKVYRYLTQELLMDPSKANLLVEIAQNHQALRDSLTGQVALYLHIPFCPGKCSYCSFFSLDSRRFGDLLPAYLESLEKELEAVLTPSFLEGRCISSIYIGGGTPGLLSPTQIKSLFRKLDRLVGLDRVLEISFEAGRPDCISKETLQAMRECKVNRVCINPQTLQAKTLKRCGRLHTPEQCLEVFEMAKEMGFDTISMDLILGLPGETLTDVQDTLKRVVALRPQNLTLHSLAVKAKSAWGHAFLEENNFSSADVSVMMEKSLLHARSAGYIPYYLYRQKNIAGNLENLGLCQSGHACRYNIGMMDEVQTILGFGCAATTKIKSADGRFKRLVSAKDPFAYIRQIDLHIQRQQAFLRQC